MTQTFAKSALLLLATSTLALSAGAASAAVHHRHHHHHAANSAAAEADQAEASTYKVKKGDTLGKIAGKLGVPVAELKRANRLKGTAVKPGQVLKVPGAAPAKGARHEKAARAEAAQPTHYKVRRGDTLDKVAKKLGVSLGELRAANGLSRHGKIHTGQTLKVPGAEESSEAAPPTRRGRKGGRAAAPEEAYAPSEGASRSIGKVVEVEGPPRTYRVKRGDTLAKVAEKLDLSVAQLKRENHLRHASVRRGQVLRGRGEMVKAYVVGPGDTTYSISRRFDVSVERLRAANGMGRRGTIHTGEKLRLPSGYRDHGPAAGAFRPPYEAPPERPEATQPYAQPPVRPSYTPPAYVPPTTARPGGAPLLPQTAPAPTDSQISEMGRGKFLWPLQGQIISDFGAKPSGQRNDGINIQASTGDPVHAAAAGDVVYAGDQVPGYGNLVLINHPDGWVTAYAHLSRVEVKMQQKVSQGQEIGQAGSTGGVTEPQVHFEVRYHANPSDRALPVDPKLVLPK
ncbi:MAG TPA: LysM peptidoglycan-binding domain-containing protein [Phenylobacterium sp.]|nr:LysM peptidoglycan-binding domain-containing protein [Phenylobacterium sp.]